MDHDIAEANCFLGSAVRGTLTARAIAQNDMMPSIDGASQLSRMKKIGTIRLQRAATIWVSRPSWFWKPPTKYAIPPRPSPVT